MTAEDRLILALAGTASHRRARRDEALRLAARVAPDRLAARLQRLRLLGVVGPRAAEVLAAAGRPGLERRASAWIEARRRRATIHATLLFSIRRALAAAGIDAVALKGPDLSLRCHGDLAVRSSADLDVLVRARRLRDAVDVLARFGYRTPSLDVRHPWHVQLHHELRHSSPAMPTVELHWRIECFCGATFSDGALDRAAVEGDGTHRLQPVDELAALLVVVARDGFSSLRSLVDVAAWWDRYGPEVPDAGLVEIAVRHPGLARPLAATAVLAERVVGLPAPRLLDVAAADGRRSRLALRLADPFATGPAGARPALVDALLCDRRALRRWIHFRLAPQPERIARRYGLVARGGRDGGSARPAVEQR